MLTTFLKVSDASVGWYIIPLAIGNFLGPLLLGPAVRHRRPAGDDHAVVRRLPGLLLVLTGVLFANGTLNATTLTIVWMVVFFFASAGASAAYLTVSEIFPMETRAMAIAFFYAVGTGIGGIIGPLLFGKLIDIGHGTRSRSATTSVPALMIAAGLVEMVLGVEAAQRSLEDVAEPLTAQDAESDDAEHRPARRAIATGAHVDRPGRQLDAPLPLIDRDLSAAGRPMWRPAADNVQAVRRRRVTAPRARASTVQPATTARSTQVSVATVLSVVMARRASTA